MMHLSAFFLAAATLLGAPAMAASSNGCGAVNSTLTSGTHKITVGGVERQYTLKLPDGYDGKTPKKLIFTLHWRGASMSDVVKGTGVQPYYGLDALSKGSAIFVAPDGIDNGWSNTNGRDVTFIDAIQKDVEAGLCIDTDQRFSTGFSYGGAMSYALACARPKVFRAVAVLSGGEVSGCDGGNDPVAYLAIHGINDSVLPFSGGMALKDRFVKNNGCTAKDPATPAAGSKSSVRTDYTCTKKPLSVIAYDGGHDGAPLGVSNQLGPDATWGFFTSS